MISPHKKKYWLIGIFFAFSGVAIVKFIAENINQEYKLITIIIGYVFAFGGLFTIMLSNRIKEEKQ